MKLTYLIALFYCCTSFSFANHKQDVFFNNVDQFLKAHVSSTGLVNYAEIKKNQTELNEIVNEIAHFKLGAEKSNLNLAFYINAYNILTIKNVVNHYPLKSPLDVNGFFDKIKFDVAGEKLVLNDIENKKIRPIYKDSRIHFVLVCAAQSCPKLMNYAYKPSLVEKQLEERTKATLNDTSFIRIKNDSKIILFSEIFKWYKDDFLAEAKSLTEYLNKFGEKNPKISNSFKEDFYPYIWKLNNWAK